MNGGARKSTMPPPLTADELKRMRASFSAARAAKEEAQRHNTAARMDTFVQEAFVIAQQSLRLLCRLMAKDESMGYVHALPDATITAGCGEGELHAGLSTWRNDDRQVLSVPVPRDLDVDAAVVRVRALVEPWLAAMGGTADVDGRVNVEVEPEDQQVILVGLALPRDAASVPPGDIKDALVRREAYLASVAQARAHRNEVVSQEVVEHTLAMAELVVEAFGNYTRVPNETRTGKYPGKGVLRRKIVCRSTFQWHRICLWTGMKYPFQLTDAARDKILDWFTARGWSVRVQVGCFGSNDTTMCVEVYMGTPRDGVAATDADFSTKHEFGEEDMKDEV